MRSNREINEELFYQLDLEDFGYKFENLANDYPFHLLLLGEIEIDGTKCPVYEFLLKKSRFLFVDSDWGEIRSVTKKFGIADLQALIRGKKWIYAQKPIDLNTSDLSDDSLPSAIERRKAIEALFRAAFPAKRNLAVLEGHYLRTSGETIGLVKDKDTNTNWVVASCFAPSKARFGWKLPEFGVSPTITIAIGFWLLKKSD